MHVWECMLEGVCLGCACMGVHVMYIMVFECVVLVFENCESICE